MRITKRQLRRIIREEKARLFEDSRSAEVDHLRKNIHNDRLHIDDLEDDIHDDEEEERRAKNEMKITRHQLKKIVREACVALGEKDFEKPDDGEVGMAINQLQAISATAMELADLVHDLDYVPEWGDGKIATVLDRLNSVRSHMLGKSVGREGSF